MLYLIIQDFTVGVIATDNSGNTSSNISIPQDPSRVTQLVQGVYNITITPIDNFGNDTDYVFELAVRNTLGIEKKTELEKVSFYPNPAEQILIFYNPKNIELKSVEIFDTTGCLVKTIKDKNRI